MTRTSTSEAREFGVHQIGFWPLTAPSCMAAAFLAALVLATIVLAVFGAGDRGTRIALQVTGRWSFLFFWLAYAGGAIEKLCGTRLDGLARRGREFGLAFALALLIHVGLILWLFHIAAEPPLRGGDLVFFSVGLLCTYLFALFSLSQLREALWPRLWRTFRTIALEYIALVFAVDFVLDPLQAGVVKPIYLLTYLPFALMLGAGVGLRIAALFAKRGLAQNSRRHDSAAG